MYSRCGLEDGDVQQSDILTMDGVPRRASVGGLGVKLHLQNPTGMEAGLVDGMGHQHLRCRRVGAIITTDMPGGLLSCR